ncbi:MAG: hypothetical protein V1820_04410 [archaeon]
MGSGKPRGWWVVACAGMLLLVFLLGIEPAFSAVQCSIGETLIACPFDFSSRLNAACSPPSINNSVKVEVNYPGNFTPDQSNTYLSSGGTAYRTFYREGSNLYFPAAKISAGTFLTFVTASGITAKTNDSTTVSTCPCSLDSKGFSVKYDEATGRQTLRGVVSGCPANGTVFYRVIFFISKGGAQVEAASVTSTGEYLEVTSANNYSSDELLSFQVAVTDATTGAVYGLFPPEVFKANDFSANIESAQPVQLTAGARTDLRVNLTNRGGVAEYYETEFIQLPAGWQSASTTTRALAPGESGTVLLSVSATDTPSAANATMQTRSSITGRVKTQTVSFRVVKTVSVSSEIYTALPAVLAGEEFDVTTLIRVLGSLPEEKVYWTIVSDPVAKMGTQPYGKLSAYGTQTFSNRTHFQKLLCAKGTPNYRKLWLILKAVLENPGRAEEISAQVGRYGNGTGLESDVSNFAASKNKTFAAASLISKLEAAEQKMLSNCTANEGTVYLSVFSLNTFNGATFESSRTPIEVSGKSGSFSLEAISENVSIPKAGSGNATFRLTSKFSSDKQVSLRIGGATSFRVEFLGGPSAKVPVKGAVEFNVSISDKGTIVKTSAEPLRIEATTTDVGGEPVTASAQVLVSVRSALLELAIPIPAQTKIEQGANKTIEFSFKNTGAGAETFSFSPFGPAVAKPATLEIQPGKTEKVSLTISLDKEVVEGSKIPAGITGKSASTGEETLFKTDVVVISSERTRLRKNIDGLIDEIGKISVSCRYYSLSKLRALSNSANTRLENGELTTAKNYYDNALKEFEVAEERCQKPDTAATLIVFAGIVAVGGAIYYFAIYRRKGKPPQTGSRSQYPGYYQPQQYPGYPQSFNR